MKSITKLLIVLMMLFLSVAVFAGDDVIFDAPGGANDPAENEDANACFAGGTLAGKCSSTDVDFDGDVDAFDWSWMWTCGWYLIRFEDGMISRENMDGHYCEAILPKTAEQIAAELAAAESSPGCYSNGTDSYFLDAGIDTTVETYSDPACTTPTGNTVNPLGFLGATSLADANAKCAPQTAILFGGGGYTKGGLTLYNCN